MGDIVIKGEDGVEMRFTHADFLEHGKPDAFGNLRIELSEKLDTLLGFRQMSVSHTPDIEIQENEFGGHEAFYGDIFGDTSIFVKNDSESKVDTMRLPDGKILEIFHEPGNAIVVDGEVNKQTKELNGPELFESKNRLDIFRRR